MEGGLEERSKEQILLEHDNVSETGSFQTQAIEEALGHRWVVG